LKQQASLIRYVLYTKSSTIMRYFSPDTRDSTGMPDHGMPDHGMPASADRDHGGDSSHVPTGMDNDPNADEEIIDQQVDDSSPQKQYPKPADTPKIVPDNLADSIAYALDGSGPGPTNDTPNVSGHNVITKGITGADLDDEEETMRV
jgi:hypothetical protein